MAGRPCFFSDATTIDRSQPSPTQSAIQNALVNQYHIHNFERWFGSNGGAAPGSVNSLTPYTLTTGGSANTFGTPVQIFNGTETPFYPGAKYFDLHRLQIAGLSQTGPVYWRIRIANNSLGETSYAQAVANLNYAEIVAVLTIPAVPFELQSIRLPAGTILWGNIASSYGGSANLNLFFALHEYLK